MSAGRGAEDGTPAITTETIAPVIERALSESGDAPAPASDDGASPPEGRAPTPAAVLVPLIDRDSTPQVLLTRRSPNLSTHAGQIGFPGGRIELGESAENAAIREAGEEVGIRPESVRVAGRLEPYLTVTGFLIEPFVAWIDPPYDFVLNPAEVNDIFEMPLARIFESGAIQRETVSVEGRRRSYYSLRVGPHYIWGATAGMLVSFRNRLDP